jgi:hypothetical protein
MIDTAQANAQGIGTKIRAVDQRFKPLWFLSFFQEIRVSQPFTKE